MKNEIDQLIEAKDNAYWERNQLVAALSKLFPAWLAKHPENDKEWEDDWRTIVFISIPAVYVFGDSVGPQRDYQLSWHIHDTDIAMFDHLRYEDRLWDGHSTEEKYRRLRMIKPQQP